MLESLRKEAFAECVNEVFRVARPGSADFQIRLTEVTEQFHTPRQEAFSVVFHGPADSLLQQGVYHLSNERLGDLELFLVPIAQDQDGYQYEAVFNRLMPVT